MRLAVLLLGSVCFGEDAVLTRVASHADRFGTISRQIWEYAEVGFKETKSSALLRDELKKSGFSIQDGVAAMPTAFVASYGSGKPVIAILGEYDALPGMSQKDIPVKEALQSGAPGHACGHNLLGSGAALAAVAVKEEMESRKLKGTIRFYGTPAEEGGGGKIHMLKAGLFQDVDTVLAWHPGDTNVASIRSCLATNGAKFKFYGTAAHAAFSPDQGRSALDAAMLMGHAIDMLREHVPQETRLHYIITNGGAANNIVPAYSEISLGARHPDAEVLAGIWDRVVKCAQAGALATGTRVEVEQGINYSNILPNDALTKLVGRNLRKAGGYEYNEEEKKFAAEMAKSLPSGPRKQPHEIVTEQPEGADPYSTDVGDVSWNVPTFQLGTATAVPGTPGHSWQEAAVSATSIGRKGMLVAARTLALSAIDLLEHPAEIDAAKTSFEKRRAGRQWKTNMTPFR